MIYREALMKSPLLYGNIQKETDKDKENKYYYDFMRFGDSSTVHNLLKQLLLEPTLTLFKRP